MPAVVLAAKGAAPGVQRVIHGEGGLEKLVVIGDVGAETEGNGEEPCSRCRPIQRVGVGRADDLGESRERCVLETIFPEERIKAAQGARVSELDSRYVERDCAFGLGNGEDL